MRYQFSNKQIVLFLWIQAAVSIVFGVWALASGPHVLKIFSFPIAGIPVELAFRLDALSTLVFFMVSILSLVIGTYSSRYLDGEPHQGRFFVHLFQTILAVSILVLSNNLLMFFISWIFISISLNKLLLFYPDRKRAVYAARKKMLVSRLGDLALFVAIILIYKVTKSFDFDAVFSQASIVMQTGSFEHQQLLTFAAILLASGAMAKSAQFPFHFWLPETMDTPTPVSALMHAGIINAGGFLVLRMSPILTVSDAAEIALVLAGVVTAVYGSLVMTTQNDIKKKLAYSTISQMGLMMFACGVSAPGFALFHIIAHSFYKAYAFLSIGSLVEESKKLSVPIAPLGTLTTLSWIAIGGAIMYFGLIWQGGIHLGAMTYLGVLVLGLSQTNPLLPKQISDGLSQSWRSWNYHQRKFLGIQFILVMLTAMGMYFLVELGLTYFMESTMGGTFGKSHRPSDFMVGVNVLGFSLFAFGYWLNNQLLKSEAEWAHKLYINLWNGSFMSALTDQFLNKYWRFEKVK